MSEPKEKFDEWGLIELFGHQQIVGRISETSLAGGAFLRVDVPAINGSQAFTRFYGPGAIYSINPVTESVARGLLTQSRFRNEPVARFDLPQLAEKVADPNPDYCPDCQELQDNCRCGEREEDLSEP